MKMASRASAKADSAIARPERLSALVPVLPALVVAAFFVVPLLLLGGMSFRPDSHLADTSGWSGENYAYFFEDRFMRAALLRTLLLATVVGAVVTVISMPIAYAIARSSGRQRAILLAVCIAPELAGVVLRTYGWLAILDRNGLVNQLLIGLGLIDEPLRMLNSFGSVALALVHVMMPFGVLSLLTVFQTIDPSLERAAQILGAGRIKTFVKVVLPLAIPGMVSSFFISFALTAGAYATPSLLGGSRFDVLAIVVYKELFESQNWPMAAVASIILLALVLICALIGARIESWARAKTHG